MRYCGLFVGINQYSGRDITPLSFAERDAEALHAAFADANQSYGNDADDCSLLLGGEATKDTVLRRLAELADRTQASTTELVVVHFSGHGSHDGRLLTSDSDVDSLDETAVALSAVTSAMARIRASHIIVTLDSCFAGTVRGEEGSPNDDAFRRALLDLAGTSRTVAWGAGPFEPARESEALRHGVFSSGLVRGLFGEAVIAGQRLSLVRWLEGAMKYTVDFSRASGHPQTPSAHLHLSGEAVVPAVLFGPRQQRLRERDAVRTITSEPASLLSAYSWVDQPLVDALRSRLGPAGVFNPLQIEAVSRAGVLGGANVVVSAPTAAGKTVVGELAVLRSVRAGQRAFVVLPMRALVNEQWEAFQDRYGALGLTVIRSCGDVSDDDVVMDTKQFDVAFVTYEKLLSRVLASPTLLDGVGVVVLDEVQLLRDEQRGRAVELLVARVRRTAGAGPRIQIVALCGEVGELNRLPDWLAAELVVERQRPVPLVEGVIGPTGVVRARNPASGEVTERQHKNFPVRTNDLGSFRYAERARTRMVIPIALEAVASGQVLVFRTTRDDVFETAAALAATQSFPPAAGAIGELATLAERSESPRARARLVECLAGGVGVHMSDLDREERRIVEKAYHIGEIRILCATTTLAMGVNLPVRVVVIADDSFFAGIGVPPKKLSVIEYRQMGGRAGRNLSVASEGACLIVAATTQDASRYWTEFITASGEGLRSGLDSMPREDLVLALLAVTGGTFGVDLERAAFDTFWAFSEHSTEAWRAEVRTRLQDARASVESAGFLVRLEDNQLQLNELGRVCAAQGLAFRSATRLLKIVDAMKSAGELFDPAALIGLVQATDELSQNRPPRANKKVSQWRQQAAVLFPKNPVLRQGLEGALTGEQISDEDIASRFKRWMALTQWVAGRSISEIENTYSSTNDVPAFGPFSGAADRTADLLPAVAALVAARIPGLRQQLAELSAKMRIRIRHGVSDAGGSLMRLGIGMRREEAETLVKHGIVKPVDLASALLANDGKLEALLGTSVVHALRSALSRKPNTRGRIAEDPLEPLPTLFVDGSAL